MRTTELRRSKDYSSRTMTIRPMTARYCRSRPTSRRCIQRRAVVKTIGLAICECRYLYRPGRSEFHLGLQLATGQCS